MQTFLTIIILVLSVVILIRVLRKHQARVMQDTVDRSTPLQPLDLSFEETNSPPDSGIPDNWQDEVKRLREQGNYAEAIALCRRLHPRMQAFRQSLLTLRAQVRDELRQQHNPQRALLDLYRHAALADLFRSQNRFRDELKNTDLEALANHAHTTLELPYREIGYRYLKLLTKTDIRQFRDVWGEPEVHQHTDDFVSQLWPETIARYPA